MNVQFLLIIFSLVYIGGPFLAFVLEILRRYRDPQYRAEWQRRVDEVTHPV